MTMPAPKVSETKSFLLLILAIGVIGGGAGIAVYRHPAPPEPAAEPASAPQPLATAPRPPAAITRSVDGAVVRAGPAVARVSRSNATGDYFARRFVDWQDRRIATSVARALAEPEFAAALGLTPAQITALRQLNLAMSPPYTTAQTVRIVNAYRAWENASGPSRSEAEANLIAAVAAAGETLEARPEFSAQVAQVRTIVSDRQWEQLRFPTRVPETPATATRPTTIPK